MTPSQHAKVLEARTLVLPLKREYFEAILFNRKAEEYRLVGKYWDGRLKGRTFDRIVLTLGYPARDNAERRIVRPWQGYTVKRITHPHFGPNPVDVYAIKVSAPPTEHEVKP